MLKDKLKNLRHYKGPALLTSIGIAGILTLGGYGIYEGLNRNHTPEMQRRTEIIGNIYSLRREIDTIPLEDGRYILLQQRRDALERERDSLEFTPQVKSIMERNQSRDEKMYMLTIPLLVSAIATLGGMFWCKVRALNSEYRI